MVMELELDRSVLEKLREVAANAGLSAEGYVLTLIEELAGTPGSLSAAPHSRRRWFRRKPQPPRALAEESLLRMRVELQIRKEEAVDAVAAANTLQRITAQQERAVAEMELRATQALRGGDRELALRSFQESRICAENLERTLPLRQEAAKRADELLTVFKREEAELQRREARKPSHALDALEAAYAQRQISPALMEKRIEAAATPDEWMKQFEEWAASLGSPDAAAKE